MRPFYWMRCNYVAFCLPDRQQTLPDVRLRVIRNWAPSINTPTARNAAVASAQAGKSAWESPPSAPMNWR